MRQADRDVGVYELGIMGNASDEERECLSETVERLVEDFGLAIGSDVVIHDGASVGNRHPHAAFAAVYFGGSCEVDDDAVARCIAASAPVIPVIRTEGDFATDVPALLKGSNGIRLRTEDIAMTSVATALLECVGLLRRQRRVFVSYRRTESRAAAVQLHDLLSARGFDVFLDTHGIRPGDPFQQILWHRLCDSDVLLMLDTPSYFESSWTRFELGRARAKEIHVLRVIWPGHQPSKFTDLAETVYLDAADMEGDEGPITSGKADDILLKVEWLRSRSIAARYMSLTGRLRADIERIGARVEGIGAHRAIALRLLDDTRLWAYPVVGLPTAEALHDVAEKGQSHEEIGAPVLVYDHVGISESWSAHLKWLDEQITAVRAIKVTEAGWTLAAWDERS
jgi:hypothetical protein